MLRSLPAAIVSLVGAAYVLVSWWGTKHLLSPDRRSLQDYHREILGDPDRFGLDIVSYTGPGATPCLFVTAAGSPGEAKKSRIVREELSRRGVPLPDWNSSAGTVVLLHGHRGRKEDHLPICERFCAAGFRCIVPDIPGQGDHPAAFATFGKTEAGLVENILDHAEVHFDLGGSPAFLFGVSQGGAIALQTAARSPGRWTALASVSAFSSLDRPLKTSAGELLPAPLGALAPALAFGVGCGTRLRAGFWPSEIRPVDAAASLHLPVMIAHGELDPYIGIDQGREIFDALTSSEKRFRTVEGADHSRVLSMGSHALYADVCEFFLSALPGSSRTTDGKD